MQAKLPSYAECAVPEDSIQRRIFIAVDEDAASLRS
jgi:hypothetical protein